MVSFLLTYLPEVSMADQKRVKHEGDVLGISDADPSVQLPATGRRGSRAPRGIEVGPHVTGIGDVPQRSGASGADLGGGEGSDVTPDMPDVEEKPEGINDK
jgi:hypothetical protein